MIHLNPVFIIQTKRDGKELSGDQIQYFIQGLMQNEIPDYQASAFLMAIYFQGMSFQETFYFTKSMLESGERYDLSSIPGAKADKHSTGGVGDKVSLILAPLAAACGMKVPMMSGRGLGFSGGTLDKLESIKGFQVHFTENKFCELLKQVGCVMIGQSEKIVPADKKLYALRDVTGTVECIPLIAASIVSKKVAEGSENLVFDVKVGNGAFMKTKEKGKALAKTLVGLSKKLGLKSRALLTQMDQPLGYAVGNSLEVIEAIEVLKDERCAFLNFNDTNSADLKELTIQLVVHMLELAQVSKNRIEARKLAHQKLSDGSAWKKFRDMVEAQGGSLEQILDPEKLPLSAKKVVWKSKKGGFLSSIDTEMVGKILIELGGGRKKVTDHIDPGVGLVFHKKLGAKVRQGEALVTVFVPEKLSDSTSTEKLEAELENLFLCSIEITTHRKPVPKLILDTL